MGQSKEDKTTGNLTAILGKTKPRELGSYLEAYAGNMLDESQAFPTHMRTLINQKGLRRQEIFLAADISEGYGYKILSGEKKPPHRDTILRLCIAAHFTLEETQQALRFCSMAALYPKFRRDAVLMVALNAQLWEIAAVNAMLVENEELPLRSCSASE